MAQSEWEVKVVNLKEVQDYIETIPEESFPDAKKAFAKAALNAQKVTRQFKKMNTRTGALQRSIRTSVTGMNFDDLRASVFSGQGYGGDEVKYAAVHEFGTKDLPGGEIKAKNAYKNMPGGPFLNIPGKANLTPSGIMKKSAKTVFEEGGHIRGRSVWLGDSMMFALVKSVKLKPRLGMVAAAEDEIPTLLSNLAEVIGAEG